MLLNTIATIVLLIAHCAIASECAETAEVVAVVQIKGEKLATTDCTKLSGQFDNSTSGSGRYFNYIRAQGITCDVNTGCFAFCRLNLVDVSLRTVINLLGGLKRECSKDGGIYRQEVGTGIPVAGPAAVDGAIAGPTVADACPDGTTVYTDLHAEGSTAARVTCERLPGLLEDPDSHAFHYLEYVVAQNACESVQQSDTCTRGCYVELIGHAEILLDGLNKACNKECGVYSLKV